MHGAWWSGCWKSETLRVAVTGLLHKMCTFFMAPKMPTGRDEARKRKKTPRGFSFCRLLYKNFTIAHTHICWPQWLYTPWAYQRVHHAGVDFWSWQHKRENTYVYFSVVCMCVCMCERGRERGGERHLCCVVCATDLLMGGLELENPVIYCQGFKVKSNRQRNCVFFIFNWV